MDSDTQVSINLNHWEHEITINYWGGSYKIGSVNLSSLILPSQAEMETLGYMRPGYNISGWTDVSGGTTPAYAPGAQITVTSSAEYWPVWSLSQYGIVYDMNGGDLPVSGSNPAVFDIYDAPFALAPPTRTGYAPGHWELPDGTVISSVDPTVYHWDLTLKAVWGPPNSYTVTLMDGTAIGTISVTYGGTYHSLPILSAKSGYSFSGWSLDTEGTDRVVSITVVKKGENHNLYAVWVPTDSWIIELVDSGDKFGEFSAPPSVTKGNEALLLAIPNIGYGIDSVVLTGSGTYRLENDPTQYPFNGINVVIPVSGCPEGSSMSFWVTPSEDVIIQVVLLPREYTVTVGCDVCGTEDLGHAKVYTYTIETGSWVVPIPEVPHTNSFFLGWSGTGITGVSGDPLIIPHGTTGDRAYFANWQISTKSIQYFLPGGYLPDPVREYVPGGTVITFGSPVWTGHTFMGWYTDPSYASGSEIYSTEGRTDVLNLYGKFQINQYTITFDSAGGSSVLAITQDYGTAVTAPMAPTKTGHTFAGWSSPVPSMMPAENMTLVAQWTVNQYTITWTVEGVTADTQVLDYGATPVYAGVAPTKAADAQYTYAFSGWSPEIAAVTGHQTYAAVFTSAVNQYTITFDSAGGSAVTAITQDYGTAITPPADPTWIGHYFVGWDTELPMTMPAENMTITAVWKTKVDIPVAVSGLVYNGLQQTGVVAATGYALTGNTGTNAGDYTATATLANGYIWSDGTSEYKTIDFTITQKEITVTPGALSKVYGGADPVFTYALSETATVTGALGRVAGEDVGAYAITLGDLSAGGNYTLTLIPTNFEITKAPLTVTAEDKSVTFPQALPALTATMTGFVGSDDESVLTGTLTLACGYDGSVYENAFIITPSGLTSTNYEIAFRAGTLTVSKASVEAPSAVPLIYNGSQQTGIVAAAGYTLTGNTGTNAGDYTATAALADGYIWSDASTAAKTISWNIIPKATNLTVDQIDDQTYTGSVIEPEILIRDGSSPLVMGTDYTISYSDNVNAGIATITATGMGNYSGSSGSGTFTVLRKTVDVSPLIWDYASSFVYDGTTKSVSLTYVPEGLTAQYTDSSKMDAGDFTASVILVPDGNHGISGTVEDLEWSIDPKVITVTPDALSKVYGGSDPVLSYALSEPVSVTGALGRDSGESVGTYAITIGTLSAGGNHEIIMVDPAVAFEILADCPGAPSIVGVEPGNGQVGLIWNAPGTDGGVPITGYEVWYKAGQTGDWIRYCTTTVEDGTVTGLINGQVCAFRLAAVNSAGAGPASAEITAIPHTIPGTPVVSATAGNCCVGLEWFVEDNGGSDIMEYVIYQGTEEVARTSDVLHTVAGLVNGAEYAFQVAAVNAAGEGPKSAEMIITPLSDRYDPTEALQALVADVVFLMSLIAIHMLRRRE